MLLQTPTASSAQLIQIPLELPLLLEMDAIVKIASLGVLPVNCAYAIALFRDSRRPMETASFALPQLTLTLMEQLLLEPKVPVVAKMGMNLLQSLQELGREAAHVLQQLASWAQAENV
jgi:hypothetical protein